MSSSSDSIYSVYPSRFYVGVGATIAVFMSVLPGEQAVTVKYMNGGTLEILPASLGMSFTPGISTYGSYAFSGGSTQSQQMLANLSGTGYLLGTTEVLNIAGPCAFYLSATGATTLVSTIRGLSAGN